MYNLITNEQVTDDIIKSINILDKIFFKEEYLWDEEYQLKIFNKNKKSIITALLDNKLIGYINYLTITKDKYINTLNSDIIIDDYDLDDIVDFNLEENYITVNSIVIYPDYQNGEAIKLLTNKFREELKNINEKYKIKGIITTAVSEDGNKWASKFGFKKYKELKDGTTLYIVEFK